MHHLASLLVCSLLINYQTFAESELLYIYEWPEIPLSSEPSIPPWDAYENHNNGAGLAIRPAMGIYRSNHYRLFDMLYFRALNDSRRTMDPEKATLFFIPYDVSIDSMYTPKDRNDRNATIDWRSKCFNSPFVIKQLLHSKYFSRRKGADHILPIGFNYAVGGMMEKEGCKDIFNICKHCLKPSPEDYSFLKFAKSLKNYELKGNNWFAVPYPCNYHWSRQVIPPFLWNQKHEKISVVTYIGSRMSTWVRSYYLRKQMESICLKHSPRCHFESYSPSNTDNRVTLFPPEKDPHWKVTRRSTFCFMPTGDTSSRKGLFDVMMYGCIPVTFDPLTASSMYVWHWSTELWKDIIVELPMDYNNETHPLQYDPVQILLDLMKYNVSLVRKKQELLRSHVFNLQYSLEGYVEGSTWPLDKDSKPLKDAYDITMDLALGWSSGRLKKEPLPDISHVWGEHLPMQIWA